MLILDYLIEIMIQHFLHLIKKAKRKEINGYNEIQDSVNMKLIPEIEFIRI
jgi:hypothetical protein